MKKLQVDDGLIITIKKLNLSDFWGCEYVPLVLSYVKTCKTHQRRNDATAENPALIVIDKGVIDFTLDITREQFLIKIEDSPDLKNYLFEQIYTYAFEDATTQGELSNGFAYTVYKMAEKFGQLPTDILKLNIADFNLNVSIMNYGVTEDYKNELIANLKAHNHTVSGKESLEVLERLLDSKRDSLKNGR